MAFGLSRASFLNRALLPNHDSYRAATVRERV